MKFIEHGFTEIYHQYIVLEVDTLTEELKGVKVNENDCFVLCSSFCDTDGRLQLNVLAVGDDWDHVTKGLKRKGMLGYLNVEDIYECEMKIIEPTEEMIAKNEPFLQKAEADCDDDVMMLRNDSRFDSIRQVDYPDTVLAWFPFGKRIHEVFICITGTKGPFITAYLDEELADLDVQFGERFWALPINHGEDTHLLAMMSGDNLEGEALEERDRLMAELEKFGIGFNGISFKS